MIGIRIRAAPTGLVRTIGGPVAAALNSSGATATVRASAITKEAPPQDTITSRVGINRIMLVIAVRSSARAAVLMVGKDMKRAAVLIKGSVRADLMIGVVREALTTLRALAKVLPLPAGRTLEKASPILVSILTAKEAAAISERAVSRVGKAVRIAGTTVTHLRTDKTGLEKICSGALRRLKAFLAVEGTTRGVLLLVAAVSITTAWARAITIIIISVRAVTILVKERAAAVMIDSMAERAASVVGTAGLSKAAKAAVRIIVAAC